MADLTRKGCLKKFIVFLAVLASIILILSTIIYKQFDGEKGIRRWAADKAIDNTKKLVIRQKPNGISKKEVEQTFEQLKQAVKNDQVNLIKLYQILEKYQQDSQKGMPSNEKMTKFLEDIRSTIMKVKK